MTLHPNPRASIFVHLSLLDFLIVDHNLKKVLEIGVNEGNSTLQFLKSLQKTNGILFSIDIDPMQEHLKLIKNHNWEYFQKDSLDPNFNINEKFDLLLIDSAHTRPQLEAELKKYAHKVYKNGYICLHDINHHANADMFKAFENFVNEKRYPYFFVDYKQGFVIIKKTD